jgi:hypothetical protein
LKVGTLDQLVGLSDDLSKLDAFSEAWVSLWMFILFFSRL